MRLEATDIESLRPLLTEIIREAVTDANPQPVTNTDGRLTYSEAEAAERLGVATHVLREQRKLGRIAFVRGAGRRIWYRPADLEQYLSANRVDVTRDGGDDV